MASLAYLMLAVASPGQRHEITIDRVVASVNGAAVTESDVLQEYKLEAFLERGHVPEAALSNDIFKLVLNRLIDQQLLAGEVEAQGFGSQDVAPAVTKTFNEIRRRFPNEQAFRTALRLVGLDENQLRSKLDEQVRIVRLTDHRLRPEAKPTLADVESYYRNTFIPEFASRRKGPAPPLSDVEDQIVEILVQKKIGVLLEQWLKELRSTHQVRLFPDA